MKNTNLAFYALAGISSMPTTLRNPFHTRFLHSGNLYSKPLFRNDRSLSLDKYRCKNSAR